MRHRITLMFCLLAALLLPNFSAITQEHKLQAVASYSILADVVHNIAGDRVELTTLIPAGADPHTFQPSPRELTPLSNVDVIFVNGAGIEEALLEVIEGAAGDTPIVEISACVAIIPIGASGHAHEDDDDHAHEDDDDHAHEDDDDHAHEDDDDHAHEDDDDHAHEDDDDHMNEDDDDHAHEDDDDHAHEDDDDHAHEDDDDHAHEDDDDHAHEDDDDHAHEDDDDHAHEDDDDHAHEDDDEHHHGDMESHCDEHDAEFVQIMGDEDAHDHGPVLGRLEDIDCGGHDHHADEHAHEEGDCDPHVWMDPHNAIYWSLMARDVLSELDPDHADEYAAAAAEYAGQLVALETEFILPLLDTLPVEKRVLITSHDSLGYLAHAYDFVIVSTVIPGGGTQIEPSPRDVAALINLVREAGVAAIFGETTVSTSVVETIAAETGVELAVLYSGTLTEGEPAGTYLDYMRYNLGTIVEALSAGG